MGIQGMVHAFNESSHVVVATGSSDVEAAADAEAAEAAEAAAAAAAAEAAAAFASMMCVKGELTKAGLVLSTRTTRHDTTRHAPHLKPFNTFL